MNGRSAAFSGPSGLSPFDKSHLKSCSLARQQDPDSSHRRSAEMIKMRIEKSKVDMTTMYFGKSKNKSSLSASATLR